MKFKSESMKLLEKNIIYKFVIVIIVLFGSAIQILSYINNAGYYYGDEIYSIESGIISFKNIFFDFSPGANFLPAYKLLLKILYDIFGTNWPVFKLPSLFAGIASLFFFYNVLKRIFNNKLLIISCLLLFSLSYSVIFFSHNVKPYIIEVLLGLIILNYCLSKDITTKFYNTKIEFIRDILFSILCIYTSMPIIIVIESSWLILFITSLIKKIYINIKSFIILQIFIIGFTTLEFFTYIIFMLKDDGIKQQWIDCNYYNPNSVDAVNSLIHFIYFKFEYGDYSLSFHLNSIYIILLLLMFTLSIITILLQKKYKGLLISLPFFIFITISFVPYPYGIFPFTNRIILFLIPNLIILTFAIFDINFNNKKFKIVNNIILILVITGFLLYTIKINFLPNLIFDNSKQTTRNAIIKKIKNTSLTYPIINIGNDYKMDILLENKSLYIYFPDDSPIKNIINKFSYSDKIYILNNVDSCFDTKEITDSLYNFGYYLSNVYYGEDNIFSFQEYTKVK